MKSVNAHVLFFKRFLPGIVVLNLLSGGEVWASDSREYVRRVYSSLTGLVPDKAKLDSLVEFHKNSNNELLALKIAEDNNSFYDVTLKNFFTRWSNVQGSALDPLNDMTALLIGVTRDEVPFNRAFYGDLYYRFEGPVAGEKEDKITVYLSGNSGPTTVIQKYLTNPINIEGSDMDQFEEAEMKGVSLDQLVRLEGRQASVLEISQDAVGGIFSTRAFGSAYYSAGTNRRPVAFVMKNFMCTSMEALNDVSISDAFVRRDVDRSPGGLTKTYENSCMGCHAGMDALAGAFVYYDFNGLKLKYSRLPATEGMTAEQIARQDAASIQKKINRNIFTQQGYAPSNNYFVNLWAAGQNAKLGWRGKNSGYGVADFGKMITNASGFHKCMVDQVYDHVCGEGPKSQNDKNFVSSMAFHFGYTTTHPVYFNMKQLFVHTAAYCGAKE